MLLHSETITKMWQLDHKSASGETFTEKEVDFYNRNRAEITLHYQGKDDFNYNHWLRHTLNKVRV